MMETSTPEVASFGPECFVIEKMDEEGIEVEVEVEEETASSLSLSSSIFLLEREDEKSVEVEVEIKLTNVVDSSSKEFDDEVKEVVVLVVDTAPSSEVVEDATVKVSLEGEDAASCESEAIVVDKLVQFQVIFGSRFFSSSLGSGLTGVDDEEEEG